MGVEVVRIGKALRPEIAAWRYGSKVLSRATTLAGYARNLGASGRTVIRLRTTPRRHEVLPQVHQDGTRVTVRYALEMAPTRSKRWPR